METWHVLKYKALVLDLDGTLLGPDGFVSPENRQALKEVVEVGLDIWIATGRSYRVVFGETGPLRDISFLKKRGVFHNGAYAVDDTIGYLRHYPIKGDTVNGIVNLIEASEPEIPIAIQCMKDHSFRFNDPEVLSFWGCTIEDCIDYPTAKTKQCSKIAAWDREKDLTKLHEILLTNFGEETNILLSDNNQWIQVMSKKATKETALRDVFTSLSIKPEEVIAIGDDLNDLGMIQSFGCGIAMGNAKEELKQVAKHVTLSNYEHGVSYALREILELI